MRRLLVVSLLLAGGCDLLGLDGSARSSSVTDDAGACVRDREALTDLLAHPTSCVSSMQCPPGSFCRQETGTCDWECTADSDCGLGSCDCFGMCQGPGGGDAGPAPADPTCPRDDARLAALATARAACVFDDECPYGAHCDAVTGVCAADCLGDADCGPGGACDCMGRCDEPVTGDVARLEIQGTPAYVAGDPWPVRRFDVVLAGAAPVAGVLVTAPAGLQVRCRSWEAMAAACKLTDWSFAPGSTRSAPLPFWIEPIAAGGVEDSWTVRLTGERVAPAQARLERISLDPPPPQPFGGVYEGTLTLVDASGAVPTTSGGGELRLSVRAYAGADPWGAVDLYDPLAVLSPTGKIRAASWGTEQFTWIVPSAGAGEMAAAVTSLPRLHDPQAGTITGDFRIAVSFSSASVVSSGTCAHPLTQAGVALPASCSPCAAIVNQVDPYCGWGYWDGACVWEAQTFCGDAYQQWRYELRRVGDATPCGDGCPEGTACEPALGICTEGDPWATTTAQRNSLTEAASSAWAGSLAGLASYTAGGFEVDSAIEGFPFDQWWNGLSWMYSSDDLYDRHRGIASASLDTHRAIVVADHIGPEPWDPGIVGLPSYGSPTRGIDQCNAWFPGYVAWIDAQPSFDAWILHWTPASPVSYCEDLYVNTSWSPIPSADDHVPCVHPVPYPGETNDGLLAALPAGKRASCMDVYENHRDAVGVASAPAGYSAFLDAKCAPAEGESLRIQQGSVYDLHPIYMCPYREALLGPFDAAANAERLICYDPELAEGPPLASERLGTTVLPVSGDLACASGRAPSGVELVTAGDRDETRGAGTLLADCLADLAAEPPAYPGDLTLDLNQLLGYQAFFADHACFGPGHFYPALVALEAGVPGDPKAARLLARLVQQWLQLHGFIAREGLEEGTLARVLAADPAAPGAAATPPLDDVLERLEAGWELVLSSAHAAKLAALPAAVVLAPDYRPAGTPAAAHHEQGAGLPVTLLETAAAHLEVVERFLDEAALAAYGECYAGGPSSTRDAALARSGAAIRYTLAAQLLAESLRDGATTISCSATVTCAPGSTCGPGATCLVGAEPARVAHAWSARFEQAHARLVAVRARVVDAAGRLAACKNPLGVEEGQIPIWFGDPAGDSGRFFAASDYLLSGWARPAVEGARAALADARAAWLSQRDSRIQQQLTGDDAERRREDLAARYGRELIDLCGLAGIEAKDVVAAFESGQTDPATCFLDRANPSCTEPAGEVTSAQVRFQLCLWNQLTDELFLSQDERSMAGAWPFGYVNGDHFGASGPEQPIAVLYAMAARIEADANYEAALAACASEGEARLPGPTTADPSCYRGQLGESALALFAAGADVNVATAAWDAAEKQFELQIDYCHQLESDLAVRDAMIVRHRNKMASLRRARTSAERASSLFGSFLSIASNAANGNPGGVIGAVGNFLFDAFGPDARAIAARMEDAQREFDAEMALAQNHDQVEACFHQANMVYTGIATAAAQVTSAMARADLEQARFFDLQRRVRQLGQEGAAAVAREAGREVPDLAFHYWLDERLVRFEKDLAWAKRLTYLAMRAVEYELQQSLGLRDDVLAATHPDELEDVVRVLEQEQLSRTINSRRPEDDKIVLSLRNDILRLADRAPLAPGDRAWPAQLVFQHRLWSPEYAIYDDDGTYLGQGIPFTLTEQQELELRCAERLWRVTATIQGDLLDVDTPSAPVFLIKRNSFSSQWCAGHGDGGAYQTGAMLPAGQLFHPEDRGGPEAAGLTWMAAMLHPYFSVTRSDFYRDEFAEGASDELAGRGLYGDYVLLFPWNGLLENDFPLEQVEDVLIRFDYLSIDDLGL